ncbi:MAG: PIN domain-containing protein [Candidatus Nitricoxidivorans perseverans]|uniref:PIN domain-containing protein n=1 Tax=Candidatus Nitricoxidivorans perseverans TaxID=2975601 RepID=A0AA49IYB3_9PROT|nr:MAG: PIN domain-containing protein [Candidatus Nitricoxidivorans perseverans]
MTRNILIVDTGFLVALFRRGDRLREAARSFLAGNRAPLLTTSAIIVETAFFLDAGEKLALMEWIRRGALPVREISGETWPLLAWIVSKYADRDPDLADATLVWLAQDCGSRRILTVDDADFSVYRTKSGKAFEIVEWMR